MWSRGTLMTRYRVEFEADGNPMKVAIVSVAKALGAFVFIDVQDEPLDW